MPRIFRKMVYGPWHERSQPAMEASSRSFSKRFMYFLLPPWVPATWRSRAHTDMKGEQAAAREAAHHTGTAAALPVQSLKTIVGTDAGPTFTGRIAVNQRFLNIIRRLFGGLLQLHRAQLLYHGFGFLPGDPVPAQRAAPGLPQLARQPQPHRRFCGHCHEDTQVQKNLLWDCYHWTVSPLGDGWRSAARRRGRLP